MTPKTSYRNAKPLDDAALTDEEALLEQGVSRVGDLEARLVRANLVTVKRKTSSL